MKAVRIVLVTAAFAVSAGTLSPHSVASTVLANATRVEPTTRSTSTQIQHVVIIEQENHSFDNVLGAWCVSTARCNGTTVAKVEINGAQQTRPLAQANDVVANVDHEPDAQDIAVDAGAMDGWADMHGCSKWTNYACLSQYQPSQIPNLVTLASHYAVSDATFEDASSASWGSHLELAAATLDGFLGVNPGNTLTGGIGGAGWGCDSGLTAAWSSDGGVTVQQVPSCVPKPDGSGPFEPSPVRWVPTIMDRMQAAHLSWRLYGLGHGRGGYGWSICPTFADCLYTNQVNNSFQSENKFLSDASSGHLPALSIVTPAAALSQHNAKSMAEGDNYIGQLMTALQASPEWSSTAVFITYDDCGCFYDHVAPPPNRGIRVPMIIASPWVRAGYTDSKNADFASMLAFTEHTFGLAPLARKDARAYDFNGAFDFTQRPLTTVAMTKQTISSAELRYLREHPGDDDDDT